jgi:hypothetical protein
MVAAIAASASGDNTVVAAVAGKKIRVRSFSLFNGPATANTAKWKSGAATDLTGTVTCGAAIGASFGQLGSAPAPGAFLFESVAGQALVLNLSAATAVYGWLDYSLE